MSNAALKIVEGGKSAKGRPTTEALESLRSEVHTKLRALGVFDQVAEHGSKKGWGKTEAWNKRTCEKALAYGREIAGVTLCACGQPAHHYPEDGPAMCEGCYQACKDESDLSECEVCGNEGVAMVDGVMLCQECNDKPGEEPSETVHIVTKFPAHLILPREAWVFPYFSEVVLWEACLAARAEADRIRDLLDIERAEKDAILGPLLAITNDPMYRATLEDIIFVVTLDRGRPVRDFHDKCRTLMVDAFNRDEPKYKGKVGMVFKASYDDRPSDNMGMSYTVEVKEDLPAFVSGSRLYHDKKGNLLRGEEVYSLTELGQAAQ